MVPAAPPLLLRAASGPTIGRGHLGRCLHLAAAWVRRGGCATLVADDAPAPWPERAAAAGVRLVAPGVPAPPHPAGGWAVTDGYDLSPAERRDIAAGRRHLVLDDLGASGDLTAVTPDLVLDQNAGARPDGHGPVEVLAGPRYALLPHARRGVVPTPPSSRLAPVGHLVVSLGGSPEAGQRALVDTVLAAALDRAPAPLEVTVLDGRQDLGAVLPTADLALAAAGSTCWELCRHAVPTVLVTVADNQVPVAEALTAAGAGRLAGPLAPDRVQDVADVLARVLADGGVRRDLATAGGALVDGWGADRVVTRLRSADVTLRPATTADAEVLLAWRNDPATRRASFDESAVDPVGHRDWLDRVLADPAEHHRIALDASGAALGVTRFRVDGDRAEIGVTVAPARRGQGWAAPMIDAACRELWVTRGPLAVDARVKTTNPSSLHAFRAADFDPLDPPADPADPAVTHLVRSSRDHD